METAAQAQLIEDRESPGRQMQCMEVWGGYEGFDGSVALNGLEAWVYCRPYRGAAGGGDVYYLSSCATGRITRLLLADVSGHGAGVAQTAAELRGLMRRNVNHLDQTRFVTEMNRQFGAAAEIGQFATAIVTTFFAPTGFLTLCNAGHPAPLIYSAAQHHWRILDQQISADAGVSNMPLGIVDASGYEQFDVKLEPGDLVLCYTDCLIESRGADGELLGESGLLDIVRGMETSDPPRLIRAILASVGAAATGNLSQDDITILLFRANGRDRKVRLGRRLMAPLRVLGGVFGALRKREGLPWPEMSLVNIGGNFLPALNRLWRGNTSRRA